MVSNKWLAVHNWINERLGNSIPVQPVPLSFYEQAGIQWDVLRSDLIHPICSGNKLFKLKYYLLDAAQKNYTMIHTEGGAWSNHIVASALAAKETGFGATGFIQGGEPELKSTTLVDASSYDMKLIFKGWSKDAKIIAPFNSYPIPQGGYGALGAQGAREMVSEKLASSYTHILCAVGSGTMLAGLSQIKTDATCIGIPVLKNEKINIPIEQLSNGLPFTLFHNYHFGGYAKKTPELLHFMNAFYTASKIPTDFVYTGKLMFAIHDLIQQNYFPEGSRILAIHSGGLQGNRSLTKGELSF